MKKKLLVINGHLNPGGVESSLLSFLQHLDPEQYDVDLLLLEEYGDLCPALPSHVHVILLDLHNTYGSLKESFQRSFKARDWKSMALRLIFFQMKFQGQKAISHARRFLPIRDHYDVAIAYRPGICTQLTVWAVKSDRTITWWHHGEFNWDTDFWKESASLCDAIAVVSSSCKTMLVDRAPELESRMKVIPNMLDEERIHRKADAFDPGYDPDLLQIVSLSRLTPEKHIENTILAAARLKKEGFSFQWHLVGGGELEDSLKDLARENQVEDVFFFEGSQSNPYPYLKQADLFVHPSYVESQGLVVLEALSLHIPGVITKSLGPCEFIQDGTNGLLADPDPESLQEKILGILRNRELYETIKSHAVCPKQFSPQTIMQQIEDQLLAPSSRGN